MTPDEKRLAKIANLLAKARDPAASEKEAETYGAHALKLMRRHGISLAMVDAARGVDSGIIERLFEIDGPYAPEKIRLMGRIAAVLHCRSIKLASKATGIESGAIVIGAPEDVEHVATAYELLERQAMRGMMTDSTNVVGYYRVHTYRKNWLRGFGDVVAVRLKAIEDRAAADVEAERYTQDDNGLWLPPAGPSTALVLKGKDKAVDDYFDDKWSHVNKGDTDHATMFDHGAVDGARGGRRADIGLTKVEGQ